MKIRIQSYQEGALEDLAKVDNYNTWLLSKFENYLGKNILEVGSGLGRIAFKVQEKGFNITPTDIDRNFLKSLKKINKNAFYLDIINQNLKIKGRFDTIIAINVLEHIKDDEGALENIYNLLPAGGIFVILVPAHKILFGSYDNLAGHQRRYSKDELLRKLKQAGFFALQIKHYNKLSVLGWLVNAKVLKRKNLPKLQLYALNLIVPFIDFFDKIIPFNFGLSIICIAQKRGT